MLGKDVKDKEKTDEGLLRSYIQFIVFMNYFKLILNFLVA
jgi:hypothetical protein